LGANGPIMLSIPLVGGRNQHSAICSVRIDNSENWQARHWKTITSCYNRSPWFEHFRSELEHLFRLRFEFLYDWNSVCFEWICDKMAIKSKKTAVTSGINREEVVDFRNLFTPL